MKILLPALLIIAIGFLISPSDVGVRSYRKGVKDFKVVKVVKGFSDLRLSG